MTKKRLRQHTNPLNYRGSYAGPSPRILLGGPPTELEIGPGLGELLVARAQQDPTVRILGVEVRRPYVDLCNEALDAVGATHARAIYAEAHIDVPTLVEDGSLLCIYFMFADPWFKKRHHKRRVMNLDFARLLARKLRVGGELHWATDNPPLAEEIRSVLEQVESLQHVDEIPPATWLSGRGIHHSKRGDPIFGGRSIALER